MRLALLNGQVRFPPNGWFTDLWFYIKNNHILISIFLAHPSHPYTHSRRFLVLLNSLSFAFFVTAVCQSLIPNAILASFVILTYGTFFQIVWDMPAAMLSTCPCAHTMCLPAPLRRCCSCASFVCLCCHTLLGLVFGAAGALALLLLPPGRREELITNWVESKLIAFATAIPTATLVYALVQCCEVRQAQRDMAQGKADNRVGAELL